MDEYIESNKKLWNQLADIHVNTQYYDVEGFKKTRNVMRQLEMEELGDVSGKSLLHLQCHFGLDTLSWETLGASVTGIDFSDRAITLARQITEELGMNATFLQSDIMKLVESNLLKTDSFDVVYTSHGSIYWLPDLNKWAASIVRFLKPGGIFYMMDRHPISATFDEDTENGIRFKYSYFFNSEPDRWVQDGSYAAPEAILDHKVEYGWQHAIQDIINALINAGLIIEFIHELPFLSWKMLPVMVKQDEWWIFPKDYPQLPLMYSIRARKPRKS